jgi:hypothetical protein
VGCYIKRVIAIARVLIGQSGRLWGRPKSTILLSSELACVAISLSPTEELATKEASYARSSFPQPLRSLRHKRIVTLGCMAARPYTISYSSAEQKILAGSRFIDTTFRNELNWITIEQHDGELNHTFRTTTLILKQCSWPISFPTKNFDCFSFPDHRKYDSTQHSFFVELLRPALLLDAQT